MRNLKFVVLFCCGSTILVGCNGLFCKPAYVAARVPHPPAVSRPELLVKQIGNGTPDGEVVTLYRGTIEQLINYSSQLEQIVDTYRKMSNE